MTSGPVKGVLWFCLAMAFATGIDTSLKLTDPGLPIAIILIVRAAMGLALIAPVIALRGRRSLYTNHIWLHVGRAVFWIGALYLTFVALRRLTVTETSGYLLSEPLFVLCLATLVLKERFTARKLVAIGVGLSGVIIMISPEFQTGGDWPGVIFAISAAVSFALMSIIMKKMVAVETQLAMLFWPQFFSIFVFLPITITGWVMPSVTDLLWIAVMSVCALATNLCLIQSFAAADAGAVAPAAYSALPFAMIADWFVFGDAPSLVLILGALVVMVAVLSIDYRGRNHAHPPVPD